MKKSQLKNIILKELKDLQKRGLLLEADEYTGECRGPSETETEDWVEIRATGGCGTCPNCHHKCHSFCVWKGPQMIRPDNQMRR